MPQELLEKKVRDLENILFSFIVSDRYIFQKLVQFHEGKDMQMGINTGTKIGTATTQKIGFYNTTPIIQPTNGADLTNNVTAGGTNDQVQNWTDLTTFSNSAETIRNNQHQLARKLKVVNDALRDLGLMS